MALQRLALVITVSASLFAETRISTAGNQLSIELPAGFSRPSADIMAKVYPNGKGPDMFRYSAIDGTIIADLASSSATPAFLPIIKARDEKDLAKDTRPMRWIAREITTFLGKPSLHIEYIRTTGTEDMHYQAYYVLNNSNLVFFQFSIPEKQVSQYKDSFQKSLASIRFPR